MKQNFTKRSRVMNFEILKRSHLKRNIIIGVVAVLIISAVILNFTRAKYRVTESIPLVNGTINYSLADLNAVAIYVNGDNGYTKADTIPESGYVLNEEESYCTIDGNRDDNISLSYDVTTKSLSVTPMTTRGTKCYLYFDEKGITNIEELIASKTIATRDSFSSTLTTDTTGTIYQAEDDDGTTYYFAGNPSDNWVQWAGYYWRIIRINGDGTIRLIYNGTSATQTGIQIQTSAFNSSWNNNAYVGFKYTTNNVHGTGTNSTILTALNTWYQNNLASYADDIDMNAGFCNDRTPYSGSGTGTTNTDYAAYNRLVTNKSPSFKCTNDSDLFTVSGASKGNKALQYPIGLITADEVSYAGGVYGSTNTSYYLYTDQYYWTMSPYNFTAANSTAWVFIVSSAGRLNNFNLVYRTHGVRPVINLKADTQFSGGDGTSETPFVVS